MIYCRNNIELTAALKEYKMAQTSVNIRIDKDVKKQAEALFKLLGLNMSTAFNIFIRQAIRQRAIPFEVSIDNDTTTKHKKAIKPNPGGWKGKIWMSDDFDEPLEDFKEYE